jgi:hypothetical protein
MKVVMAFFLSAYFHRKFSFGSEMHPRLHRLLHRSVSHRLLKIKNSAIDRQLDIAMGVTILLEEEEEGGGGGGGGGREELVVQHD